MKTLALRLVLSWLGGITPGQWKKALEFVTQLLTSPASGETKREVVRTKLTQMWPNLKSWVVNMLIELAVAYTRKGQPK